MMTTLEEGEAICKTDREINKGAIEAKSMAEIHGSMITLTKAEVEGGKEILRIL